MANAPDRSTRLLVAGLAECDPKTVLRYFDPTYRPNRSVARAIANALDQLRIEDPRRELRSRPEGAEVLPRPPLAGEVMR